MNWRDRAIALALVGMGVGACGEPEDAAVLAAELERNVLAPFAVEPDPIAAGGSVDPIDPLLFAKMTTEQLLALLTCEAILADSSSQGGGENHFHAMTELIQRPQDLEALLQAWYEPVDGCQLNHVSSVLLGVESRLAPGGAEEALLLAAYRGIPEPPMGEGIKTYHYRALYSRAKRGDREALRILHEHWWDWGVPSMVAAEAVLLFGEYGYEAAIPDLIEILDAASLNLGGAAYESLLKLVPGPHPELPGPTAATEYFTKLLAQRAKRRAGGVR